MRKSVLLFMLSAVGMMCYGQIPVAGNGGGQQLCVKIDGWCYNLNPQDRTAEVTSGTSEEERAYTGMTTANIPGKVKYKGNEYQVTSIGYQAFAFCEQLQSVTLPKSVTQIRDMAFARCTSLRSIPLHEGITQIGFYAFFGCSSLQSVYIPASVTLLFPGVFFECSSVRSYVVDASNPNYCSPDGVLFTKFKGGPGWLLYYPAGKTDKEYVVPDGALAIMVGSFAGCQLKKITIPSSVFTISEESLKDCRYLESVICYATKPPKCEKNVFGETPQKVPRFYVPKESIELYKAAEGWGTQYQYFPLPDKRSK